MVKQKKIVTYTQLRALRALDSKNTAYDPHHRPRGSLERLAKKGYVGGDRKSGWYLTVEGEQYLRDYR